MKHSLLFLATSALALGAWGQDATVSLSRVYEYAPAPGQFVNTLPAIAEGDEATPATFAAAAQRALVDNNSMISLGAYGGYVVFGFEKPVVNVPGEYDFVVKGNAFANNNEAGIVCVSVDVNGNGLPDDEWYELAGSEYADAGTRHGFTVTYTRPDGDDTAATCDGYPWTSNDTSADNLASGMVRRNNFHKQSYWPASAGDANTLTFTGTRLRPYATLSGTTYKLPQMEYGYADNLANTSDPGLKIEWAVNADGTPVELDHIDFVKVYTGSLQDCGWIGEVSTEVSGATMLHADAAAGSDAPELYTASFDNLPLWEPETSWTHGAAPDASGDPYPTTITSGSFSFNNYYTPAWDSWSFFGYTNTTSSEFDFGNYATDQFHSAAGGPHSGHNFLVLYADSYTAPGAQMTLACPGDHTIAGTYICNSAWVAQAIAQGDGTSAAFGDGDWLKLTLTGYTEAQLEAGESSANTLDIYLADFSGDTPLVRNTWQWVDLSPLGPVHQVRLAVSSTKNNDWGMTTPGYACFDDFGAADPEAAGIIAPESDAALQFGDSTPELYYDLQGRRVDPESLLPGLYITSRGRKVLRH